MMILDNDEKITQDTYDNSFLTRELLEKEGFKSVGCYCNYELYKYQKSGLGVVQLKVYNLWDVPYVNYKIYPDDGLVAMVEVESPVTRDFGIRERSHRYLLTVKDLKNYLKFCKLMTKINTLKHQAADMLSENVLSDLEDYNKRIRGEKV